MKDHISIYARVSSEKQAEEGTVESQISQLKDYAKQHSYLIDVDNIFIDNGVSGTILSRPALDQLRDKAFKGEINKVLILCPDRLSRKHTHQLILT